MHYSKTTILAATFAFVLVSLPSTARAGQSITFTHEGVAAGFRLNGELFVDGPYIFAITAFGDVGDREEDSGGNGWWIDHITATIEIVGVGSFGILTPTRTVVNTFSGRVGFGRASSIGGAALLDGPHNSAFFDWDMTTSIGPIFGNDGELIQWNRDPFIETTGGRLIFFDEENIPVTFTAEVVIASPAPMALLPIAAVLCPRRRRRA